MAKVAAGASITSKRPDRTGTDDFSSYGEGCIVETHTGSKKIDWIMGLHGALFGYSPEWWKEAVSDGSSNASTSLRALSEEAAAALLGDFYSAESCRFMADGSSPNEAAVRIARAATGRKKIAFSGYHGSGTSFPHNPDPGDRRVDERRGIPEEMWNLTYQFAWGDFKAVEQMPQDLAAVIVEVPPEDSNANLFAQACESECRRRGAIFILDDVVTGFRVSVGGAAKRYGLYPDLYCIGKALGNGFPISALLGSEKLLQEFERGVHYSSTFNGAGLGTTVVAETLKRIRGYPDLWITLYGRGEFLKSGMNAIFRERNLPVRMVGNPTRPILKDYTEEWLEKWRKKMYANGVLCMAAPWYVTLAHTGEIILETIKVCERSCDE